MVFDLSVTKSLTGSERVTDLFATKSFDIDVYVYQRPKDEDETTRMRSKVSHVTAAILDHVTAAILDHVTAAILELREIFPRVRDFFPRSRDPRRGRSDGLRKIPADETTRMSSKVSHVTAAILDHVTAAILDHVTAAILDHVTAGIFPSFAGIFPSLAGIFPSTSHVTAAILDHVTAGICPSFAGNFPHLREFSLICGNFPSFAEINWLPENNAVSQRRRPAVPELHNATHTNITHTLVSTNMATVSGAMPKAKTAACGVCGKVLVKRCMLRHQRTNTCRSVGAVDLRTGCKKANVTTDCEEATACQNSRCEEANVTTISLVNALNTCTPGHYVQVSDLIPHQYYKVVKLEKVDSKDGSTILTTLRHLGGFNVCYVYLPIHFGDVLTNDIISSYNSAFDVIHLVYKGVENQIQFEIKSKN
ncbi:hypothetical protein J6590_096507 [Homalodisca vitripennis]|nr:hypothetical protein J6590_096507 [Homalodisca vitripennis]